HQVDGEVVVAAELEKGLLGAVAGGGDPVGAEADPGEERDQGQPVVDVGVEEVLGIAEEDPAPSFDHGRGFYAPPGEGATRPRVLPWAAKGGRAMWTLVPVFWLAAAGGPAAGHHRAPASGGAPATFALTSSS